ncbi:MAG: DUF58 domain-containing protein [Vicinamibacterales bacterium]|jgi:uncharacterized protein (DUF58 family)|nr:DUF58 domain-containing protein [Vicinamibacterales bacterium]
MPSPAGNELSFLDPAIVTRLGSLELIARTVVEGVLVGLHRSPFQGFSVEFSEYRQYLPGDAPSTIDWKLFARSDRYYVKKFEEETNLECHLLLDVSASMGYGSQAVSKLHYGAFLAASLAYLMHRQRDGVGLTLFDDRVVESVPIGTRSGHLRGLLATLSRAVVGSRSDVSLPLNQLAGRMTRRGLVVLISDLFDEPSAVIDGLKHLRFQGSEVLVFHTLDPAELTFPFEHAARFEDLETGEEVLAVPARVREHYLAQIRALMERYRRELRLADIDYHLVDTGNPLDTALLAYLAARGRRW